MLIVICYPEAAGFDDTEEPTPHSSQCAGVVEPTADQSQTLEANDAGEIECRDVAAQRRWSNNSFIKPFQLSAQLSGFANLHMLYSIFCCLPVSSASAERVLSKLKLVKSRLRTSMSDDTMSSLLVLASEKDLMMELTTDDIIVALVKSSPSLHSHLLY